MELSWQKPEVLSNSRCEGDTSFSSIQFGVHFSPRQLSQGVSLFAFAFYLFLYDKDLQYRQDIVNDKYRWVPGGSYSVTLDISCSFPSWEFSLRRFIRFLVGKLLKVCK